MGRNMTTVQAGNTIRFGSAKFEVGPDINSLIDLGAMNSIVFEETWDEMTVTSDNAGVIKTGMSNHVAGIEGDLMEINLATLATIRGGIDKIEDIAGTPKTITNEAVTLSGQTQKRLLNKNGAGTVVTAVTVKKGATTLVAGTDYILAVDSAGFTAIARVEGGGITSGDAVTVNYTYTPLSAKRFLSGGIGTFQPRVARITNYDDAGKRFQITIYKATPESGLNITFPEADAEDPAMTPIRMNGTLDANRAVGEQLFEIYDEQGV
ncbi:hypothetical protein [Paenibacillus pseudetheri]|uniref:Uncharacterized protein n=1 Tax=Paenibacillus pseudetheri TaxID=2897682 RepID=A0ABM9B663_9BACL|nr:hypothetical protein [Paenibacillus pseudetheri]CAH1054015.1 hypothetical protein PAECIP111894_00160 [Paenibacillus pseudetheri]